MRLQEEEAEATKMEANFKSLQEELDFKSNKLNKLWE